MSCLLACWSGRARQGQVVIRDEREGVNLANGYNELIRTKQRVGSVPARVSAGGGIRGPRELDLSFLLFVLLGEKNGKHQI
jgi:hypothetical protein